MAFNYAPGPQVPSPFAQFLAKLDRNPLWRADLPHWEWLTTSGRSQGLLYQVEIHPGLANLLWLSMERDHMPTIYDAHDNALFIWAMMFGERAEVLPGWPAGSVADAAQRLTLVQFSQLPSIPGPVEALIALARERVRNGKT